MDVKSILRTFRYTELQAKADRDPNAKRPPTIKFLAVALVIGVIALGFAMLVMNYEGSSGDGNVLTVSEPTDATNSTTPSPTASDVSAPQSQQGPPTPILLRSE